MSKKHAFHIGDQVAMLNEPITGKVVDIYNKFIVLLAQDGFEYECLITEIVPIFDLHPHFYDGTDKEINDKKESFSSKNISKQRKNKPKILEIDLHIHELVDSEKGMRNIDILNLQLQTVKKQMEFAKQNKIQRVIFIHGIGAGVLKKELHHLLKKYKVEFFEASYNNYGQGATEVYIYQN
ncbi:MAG: Smr/MutS family protein [Flavobacteriaceae bacterium]|nr:Smr/MutS family protein [Flavobacteriaceae bacterium]